MAVYTYTARDAQAATVRGSIAAETPRQARDQLRARGLRIERLASEAERSAISGGRWRRRVSPRHITQLARELSTLLAVGTPLLEALDTLALQSKGRMLAVLQLLRDRVAAGKSLAQAMQEQPQAFDEMCINMTETGEDAGNLEYTLARLAVFRERFEQLKGRIGTVLIYPAIVLTVATGAVIFLMSFVVPHILQPLIEQGQKLPVPTIIVKGISDLLVAWWWLLVAAIVAAVGAGSLLLRRPAVRYAWHRVQLRIPLVGDLVRKQSVVRIAVVMSTLLKGGVVFLRALQTGQRSTHNLAIRSALANCEKAVAAGEEIAAGLQRSDTFPPLVIQVFSLGQQSGRLEEMLDRLASDYETQVATTSQRLTAILEPAIIVCLALVVLFIVLATVLPILEAGDVIH
jgi:type II secretory pathway component PulF